MFDPSFRLFDQEDIKALISAAQSGSLLLYFDLCLVVSAPIYSSVAGSASRSGERIRTGSYAIGSAFDTAREMRVFLYIRSLI